MKAINYPEIIAEAIRGAVAAVLRSVEDDGLPEANHFIMTFRTDHPGSDIPDRLRKDHPREMRIIMQHWFKNLTVGEAGFWVTLSFNNTPETIYVPFSALTDFADPGAGVQFKFLPADSRGKSTGGGAADDLKAEDGQTQQQDPPAAPAQVLSLEKFRKK